MNKSVRVPLVCTYDSEADATYVYLEYPILPGAAQQTVTFDTAVGMFNLDLDVAGRVLGLEILGAKSHLPAALLEIIRGDDGPEAGPTQ